VSAGFPLTVEPDELFKLGSGPDEPDVMHGSGGYHIECCERLIKSLDKTRARSSQLLNASGPTR
jgi:hypothetical protein